ncbi:MAG: outer membrane beta-barrel protein [candidate division Zixibacteria bacterium]|nr:outer membrane beta-barrel protein [candidate division Zixibacteria bacterium]
MIDITKMTSFTKSLSAALILALSLTSSAQSIVRVKSPPEVGRHVFEGSLGISGSLEEAAAGGDVAWSFGWSYHANNSLGIGISIGANSPENFEGRLKPLGVNFEIPGVFENKFQYLTANIHVRAPTRVGLVPHLQAGFGYYQIDFEFRPVDPNDFSERVEQGEFGMHYGVGLDYLISNSLAIGVIGNYHLISMDDDFDITAVLGDWYDTWDLKASISFYIQ